MTRTSRSRAAPRPAARRRCSVPAHRSPVDRRSDRPTVRAVLVAALLVLCGGVLVCSGRARRTPATAPAPVSPPVSSGGFHAELSVQPAVVKAGELAELVFQVKDPQGNDVRFLQFVHERPLHLLVVSED